MDVKVTHNGTNITHHVISYEREHKICTGIGMFEMEVDYTYSTNFDPWDKIVLYEEGNKSAEYYVVSSSDNQPSATISITAQDNSRRLSDYFISDYYNIDYPSYSSFWIGYFLSEVGINYKIVSSDPGVLLSNNTALGLMTAYEQIMYLLQINGWYITFDSNGTAIIGKLTTDYGVAAGSFGNRDLLSIKTIKSDNMLRNRVVVWGKGDPTTARWIFADVYKPTKWDYDKNDRRTIVISNSNIRKTVDAFWLANKALLEFSNITVEKHLVLAGAHVVGIGDIVTVKNKIFTGKGKVTTFGTAMSKDGLITNITLDERCPRLFAFWDLGGFVYVGTFGSGVWRKHILPAWSGGSVTGSGLIGFATGVYNASGWFNYSSGLMDYDLNVTDLHVNAGMLACVTASGNMFYSLEDEHPWSGVMISGLQMSISGSYILDEDGLPVDDTVYSGVLARACIIDRDTNYLKYVVDTRSGENLGDFLLETDPLDSQYYSVFGIFQPGSGFVGPISGIDMGNMRSWGLEVNGYDGTVSGVYPIFLSGVYDFYAFDIENDGTHDFYEVMTYGSGPIPLELANGRLNTNKVETDIVDYIDSDYGLAIPGKIRTTTTYSGLLFPELQDPTTYYWQSNPSTISPATFQGITYLEDNYPDGKVIIAGCYGTTSLAVLSVREIKKSSGEPGSVDGMILANHTKSLGFGVSPADLLRVTKQNDDVYTFVFRYTFTRSPSTKNTIGFVIKRYNIRTNEVISEDYDIIGLTAEVHTDGSVNTKKYFLFEGNTFFVRDNFMYYITYDYREVVGGDVKYNYYLNKCDLNSMSIQEKKILSFKYDYVSGTQHTGEELFFPMTAFLYPVGLNDVGVVGYYMYRLCTDDVSGTYTSILYRYKKDGFLSGGRSDEYIDLSSEFGDTHLWDMSDTIGVNSRIINQKSCAVEFEFSNELDSYTIIDCLDVTYNDVTSSIAGQLNILSNCVGNTQLQTYGLVNISGEFYTIDPKSLSIINHINHPDDYTLIRFSGVDFYNNELYFFAYNEITTDYEIISISFSSSVTRRFTTVRTLDPTNGKELLVGNFRYYITNTSTERGIAWQKPGDMEIIYPIYYVLRRDNYDFDVIKSGLFRDRLEISNYVPLVTMDRRVSSIEEYYISLDDTVLQISNPSISISGTVASGSMFDLGIVSEDYRYMYTDASVEESGMMSTIYIALSGAVGSIPMDSLANVSGYFVTDSGYVTRLETSNYSFPEQYMFVSLSGYGSGVYVDPELDIEGMYSEISAQDAGWGFFQKDPYSGVWVDYSSGYPQARTTIIRLDDML